MLLILNIEINVSYIYIHLRKSNKNNLENSFPTHLFQLGIQGCWSPSRWLRIQGGKPRYTRPIFTSRCTHTHIHSDGDNVDTPVHLRCTSLGCRRKLESAEKTHADSGPRWESTFFLINVITKWHCMKWCYLRTCCFGGCSQPFRTCVLWIYHFKYMLNLEKCYNLHLNYQ